MICVILQLGIQTGWLHLARNEANAAAKLEHGDISWVTWSAEVVHVDLLDLLIEFVNFSINIQISL